MVCGHKIKQLLKLKFSLIYMVKKWQSNVQGQDRICSKYVNSKFKRRLNASGSPGVGEEVGENVLGECFSPSPKSQLQINAMMNQLYYLSKKNWDNFCKNRSILKNIPKLEAFLNQFSQHLASPLSSLPKKATSMSIFRFKNRSARF